MPCTKTANFLKLHRAIFVLVCHCVLLECSTSLSAVNQDTKILSENGSESSDHSLVNDNVPFYFESEPQSQTVTRDEPLTLTCTVYPEPVGVRYFWFKYQSDSDIQKNLIQIFDTRSEVNLLTGRNQSFLHFPAISVEDQGFYYCKVQSNAFTIFSTIAPLTVNFLDLSGISDEVEDVTVLSTDRDEIFMNCVITSSPSVDIKWYKDGETIYTSDDRIFVYPEDHYFNGQLRQKRALLILNIVSGDTGLYECKNEPSEAFQDLRQSRRIRAYRIIASEDWTESDFSTSPPQIVFYSYQYQDLYDIPAGSSVTLECAAKGYPVPSIRWESKAGDSWIRIGNADKRRLENSNRRLVIHQFGDDETVRCIAESNGNSRRSEFYLEVGEQTSEYESTSTEDDVDELEESDPDSPDTGINSKQPKIIRPNQYTPFALDCETAEQNRSRYAWIKDGLPFGTDSENIGTTLNFTHPTEGDLGVYQCVVYRSATQGTDLNLKLHTSYVVLKREQNHVDSISRKPNYLFLPGPFYVDEAEEECRRRGMHLVSILSENENQIIWDMITTRGVSDAWIGLTKEVPEPIGTWRWTMPGDSSFGYSNWNPGRPDWRDPRREYAVLRNDTGQWRDVHRSSRKRAAVCKNYTVSCPSVEHVFGGKLKVRGWEFPEAIYNVGQQVEVSCRHPSGQNSTAQVITCRQDQTFELDQVMADKCKSPLRSGGGSFNRPHGGLLIFFICWLITRTM